MKNETISKMHEIYSSKQAPAVVGKPVYGHDLEYVKVLCGGYRPELIFGKKIDDTDEKTVSTPLNFGSKKSTGALPEEVRLRLFHLKKTISDVQIQSQFKAKERNPSFKVIESVPLYKNVLAPMLKAFNITDFSNWVEEVQARFYFEEYEVPLVLADLFDNMPMSSSLVRVPGALGLLEGQLETDDATFTAQTNTQSSYVVEAKNDVVHAVITQDLLDDSAPAIIDKMRKEVVKGIARAYERAILDGDDSATHIDADTHAGSAKLYTKAWKGLRKRCFDNDVALGAGTVVYNHGDDTPSKDLFSNVMKLMKCQSTDKNDLQWVIGCSTGHDLVTGAIPELFTAFAFGGLASNVTGQVPPIFGIKAAQASYVREDLELTGKAANPAAGTHTYILLVQKSRFSNWTRQATKVWAAPSLPSSDLMLMSGKARLSFSGVPQSATEKSITMGRAIKTV